MATSLKGIRENIAYLNKITGSPAQPWVRSESGRNVAQIGCYHLSEAYGGVCLHQIVNTGGAVTTPLYSAHEPRKMMAARLRAFIDGIELDD